MEYILGVMTGLYVEYFLTLPAILAICFLGILFEHNDCRGLAGFMAIVAAVSVYFAFDLNLAELSVWAVVYLVVGVVWSFWRYKRFAEKRAMSIAKETDVRTRSYMIEHLHPNKNLGKIVGWILVWPFSLIENLAGDLINAIEQLVKKTFHSVYRKIYIGALEAAGIPTGLKDEVKR